ncbi:hypothetical protein [Streptomyces sp. NPDC048577]|uniref:hypothetical protein n=1 Tax=Streptomyces sp. NPDC048577 TaxID=3157209 RepID=UPI0034489677
MTNGVPKTAQKRYSIGNPPSFSGFAFCESGDKDGSVANFTFAAEPNKSKAYLATLGMKWSDFVPASSSEVEELSRSKSKGWELKAGQSYLVNRYSREWNGDCLADYMAYVPANKQWQGEVYISMYCQD